MAIMRACAPVRMSTRTLLHTHRVLTPVASFARAESNESPISVPATSHDGTDLPDVESEHDFVLRQTSSKIFEICQVQKTNIDAAGGLQGAAANLLVVDDDPPSGENNGAREVGLQTKGKVEAFQTEKPEAEQVLAGSAPMRPESENATEFSRQSLLMEQVIDKKVVCRYMLQGACSLLPAPFLPAL